MSRFSALLSLCLHLLFSGQVRQRRGTLVAVTSNHANAFDHHLRKYRPGCFVRFMTNCKNPRKEMKSKELPISNSTEHHAPTCS